MAQVRGTHVGAAAQAAHKYAVAIARRVRPHQRIQLADQLGVSAGGEVIIVAILETGEAKLIEACDL